MLAAGPETKTEPGLVQRHIGNHQADHCQQHKPVEFKAAHADDEQILCLGVDNVGGHVVAAGSGGVHGLDGHGGTGGGQHVHCRTGDGLVGLKPNGSHCQQQGEQHTEQGAGQHRQADHGKGAYGDGQELHHQCAAQGTDDHDALQTDVDDTAALCKTAAQGHQHQNRGENQGVLQQKDHLPSPPSLVAAARAAFFSSFTRMRS